MNTMHALRCAISIATLAGLLPNPSAAAPALPSQLTEQCAVNAFTVTRIEKNPLDSKHVAYAGSQAATRCLGLFSGNDASGTLSAPRPNVGLLYNGLLNGQSGVLDPAWFNNTAAPSPMLDLDKDGSGTDPGWIYLGQAGQRGRAFDMASYNKPIKMADTLKIQFECTDSACTKGTWSLRASHDIGEKMRASLGRHAFDHLAFVLQASDRFAIYDFDFNLLSTDLPGFDNGPPHAFTGTWDANDFRDKNGKPQNVSHVSVWARAPAPTALATHNEVPEPGAAVLVALGLAGVAVARRRRA